MIYPKGFVQKEIDLSESEKIGEKVYKLIQSGMTYEEASKILYPDKDPGIQKFYCYRNMKMYEQYMLYKDLYDACGNRLKKIAGVFIKRGIKTPTQILTINRKKAKKLFNPPYGYYVYGAQKVVIMWVLTYEPTLMNKIYRYLSPSMKKWLEIRYPDHPYKRKK